MVPLMTIIVVMQVVMRYIFQSPFIWAEEAARYLLIWISCLGSTYAVKKHMHLSVLFLNKKLKGRLKSSVAFIIHLSVFSFFTLCVVYGLLLSISEWEQVSPALGMRMTWVLLGIPVGFGLMAVFILEEFIEDVRTVLKKKEMPV